MNTHTHSLRRWHAHGRLCMCVLWIGCLVGHTGSVYGQKFGYVHSDFILQKMPGYAEAKQEIDSLAQAWQAELEGMFDEVEQLERQLAAEKVLMTEEMIAERRLNIEQKSKAALAEQQSIFGYEGRFFLKQKETLLPVQNKVYAAIEKVARQHRLHIVFDKSSELIMLYTNPVHDYTEYVLEVLGLGDKPNKSAANTR